MREPCKLPLHLPAPPLEHHLYTSSFLVFDFAVLDL